jgi:hypothetical protein
MNLARRCARVIAALQAAGADEALVRFIQPIDLAIHAAQPPEVTGDELPAQESPRAAMPRGPLARSGAATFALKVARSTHGG